MTVVCGAGTPVDELAAALAEHGQEVALPAGGTVGGALAVGRSDVLRLGRGPVRDTLLQARYVAASGEVVTAGGPTVKNVSGFDLCRVLVGSRGTLGVLGEVMLRTRPIPTARRWFTGTGDPFVLLRSIHRAVSVLWDGGRVWVCLEGHPADVAEAATAARLAEVEGPPPLPTGGRWSVRPSELRTLGGSGRFVAEVGVGVVHHEQLPPVIEVPEPVRELNRRIASELDPTGRLNPGVDLFGPVG
jgi:glycolate oxidase FAD binding subunit